MQTIYLDISNKGNVSTINAKQGDVGRKFRAIITENGIVPTTVDVETSEFSVWYSGASGNGNYKTIGDRSAFYQENNTVVVELIRQMLKVPGKGELSLSMEYGGDQIGLWNIPYDVEAKPGADSETATDYFDDLANAQQKAEEAADRAEDAAYRAENAADRAEASIIVSVDEGEVATHTAAEIYDAMQNHQIVVFRWNPRAKPSELIPIRLSTPSVAVFSKPGYPTEFDIFDIEINNSGTISYNTHFSSALVNQAAEKVKANIAPVSYLHQVLTEEQQAQARKNIGSASQEDLNSISARYDTIEDALAGTNIAQNGKVATHIIGDNINIILLDDIASATTINITKDCTLHLNGKTLSFTAPGAYLNVTTASKVTINGEVAGSEITKNIDNGGNEKLVSATDTVLNIVGGTYSMYGQYSNNCMSIRSESANTKINISGVNVIANNEGTGGARGMQVDAANISDSYVHVTTGAAATNTTVGIIVFESSEISNCKILVASTAAGVQVEGFVAGATTPVTVSNCHIEADGHGDSEGTVYRVCAISGNAGSSLTINGGYYWGAREALSILGVAHINGGVHEGCQHGGAYLSSTDIKVKNATFRNVEYTGDCGWSDVHYGAVFCGSPSKDANVSFDNCRFESEVSTSHAITAKYTNTNVYLSNSVINGIFGDDLRADATCTIYVGKNVVYDTIGVPVNPDDTITYHGTIDTTTYAGQEFGFETETTDYENLINIKISLLQDKVKSSVLYTSQDLTEVQKAQARENIGISNDPDCHAQFFTITENGVVSLKSEYRGATTKATYLDSISDMGSGVAGSKNKELPVHLVIPEIVNGIVVNRLAAGMFCNNTAIEYVALPRTIKEIPEFCFFYACRLKEIFGTENITALGERALNRASSLIRANFPSLTSMQLMSIQGCPSLIYADIGRVQTVGEYSLACNINMQRLKNSGDVTGIDPTAFYKCARLKHFENLEKLSTIGATGLWGSGIPYTEQAKLADCTLGTYAIAPQVNPTDYWSECTYTPCENPLPTYLAQNNPLWENRAVGSKTYASACMLFDVVHAYCGLHNITLSDVDDLEAMVNDIDPALLTNYVGTYTYQTVLAKGIGLNVESYGTIDKTVLQTLYDALAAGKYASVTISSGNNGSVKGHCALIYGVTATGELMFCDCNSVWWHDFTKPYLYTLPIQNIMAYSISGRNTILEIYSV